jgi:RNA polymerase sigma-32 factor
MQQHDAEAARFGRWVQSIPRLDRERELALVRAYKATGDRAAAHAILRANVRHVVMQAARCRRYGVGFGELVAQGNLALCSALERFDPERGVRFATYASHWVRAEMLIAALRQRSIVDGGRGHLRARYAFGLRRAHGQLSARFGERADQVIAQLAQRFARDEHEIRAILARLDGSDASLDARSAGDTGPSLLECLAADEPAQEDQLERDRLRRRARAALGAALADLDRRERCIVERRWLADEPESLCAIGKRFGVSRERARQIEAALQGKLRKRLRGLRPIAA